MPFTNRLKRFSDVTLAGAVLLLASPIMLAAAAAIRLSMGTPVLFHQERVGLREGIFTLYKFRSMRNHGSCTGTAPDEQRITRLGWFLRETSIDELPELWNVLRGDMSLAGPRPLLPEYLPLYTACQRRRHDMRPGISGWAQVHGRNGLGWDQRLDLDVWYVDHWSLGLDVRILWRTALAVLRREGISQAGHATMSKFTGIDFGEG
jgi:sugar transferase EpsL